MGVLEAYHDGMMPGTAHDPRFRGLARFEQRTLRWPGFTAQAVQLRALGFFSDAEVVLAGQRLRVRDVTDQVLASLSPRIDQALAIARRRHR